MLKSTVKILIIRLIHILIQKTRSGILNLINKMQLPTLLIQSSIYKSFSVEFRLILIKYVFLILIYSNV